jgi:CRISPR-associated protein Cas2
MLNPPSGYKGVWLFAMFDLPTETREDKSRYVRFRHLLLKQGFEMMQFSVYARYYPSEEDSERHRAAIRKGLPPDGSVRLLLVTDKQFGKMECYIGKKKLTTEKPPDQMLLF